MELASASKFEIKILRVLSLHTEYSMFHWEFQCNHVNFENILKILLNWQQANIFNLQHLQRSKFRPGLIYVSNWTQGGRARTNKTPDRDTEGEKQD